MTLLERVYKKSTKDKNLAESALDKISMPNERGQRRQAKFKKKAPVNARASAIRGKSTSRPPAGVDVVLPSSAEVELDLQRQKVKK